MVDDELSRLRMEIDGLYGKLQVRERAATS